MSVQGRGGHCSAAQEATCPPDPPQPRGFRSSATATPWVLFSIRPSVAAAQLLCGRSQSAETRDRPCHVVLGTLQGLPKSSLGLQDPLWPHPASGAWPPPPPLLVPPQSWLSSRQAQCYPRAFAPAVSGTSFTHALAPESSFPFSSAPLPSPPCPSPPLTSPPFH